jgi:hypothetical protein
VWEIQPNTGPLASSIVSKSAFSLCLIRTIYQSRRLPPCENGERFTGMGRKHRVLPIRFGNVSAKSH